MINMTEYAKRRKALMQEIGSDAILILPAAPEILRNGDAVYAHRQNSDFYYLTGFNEPEAVMVLAPKRKGGEYILFNRVRDPAHEIWDGPRAGQEGARKHFQANESYPIGDFKKMLPELLAGREVVHYPLARNNQFDKTIFKAIQDCRAKIRTGLQTPKSFVDIEPTIHEMRLLKSAAEIATMQKAVDITAVAHEHAMKICKPGMYEYELEAALQYDFIRHGARFAAYNSIVGSGRNTCILHYITNDKKIENGDLVLIDAGAEYQNYAADITRTFPANGKFSGEQRAIYELVLEAQLAAIAAVKPGASFTITQDKVVKVITQGLVDLKLLKGRVDDLIEKKAYFDFYMHRAGHWLGIDVHDVGQYKVGANWRKLAPGMVLTVEPGIYISSDLKHVPKNWHNIGVRIEDNVLVTKKGHDVLSQKIPKKVKEIESLVGSA